MISIRINSELAMPLIFRFAQQGAHVEVSQDISGYIIEIPGEDTLTGETRQDFMRALRQVRKSL